MVLNNKGDLIVKTHWLWPIIAGFAIAVFIAACFRSAQSEEMARSQAEQRLKDQLTAQKADLTPDWEKVAFTVRVYEEYTARSKDLAALDKKYKGRVLELGFPGDWEISIYRWDMAHDLAVAAYLKLRPVEQEAYCWMNRFESWTYDYDTNSVVVSQELRFPENIERSEFFNETLKSPRMNGDVWDHLDLTNDEATVKKAYEDYKADLQKRGLWVEGTEI